MKNKLYLIILIGLNTFLNPIFSFGQELLDQSNKKIIGPLETRGDPYMPNTFNQQKTSPAYHYSNQLKSTGSSITTVQVNVNPGGQNILGDAANEPNIAVNPLNPNEMVIGWRQFDNVTSNFRQAGYNYSSNSGLTWTLNGLLEPGIFRTDPVVDYDRFGNFYYNSLTIDDFGNYPCKVFKSTHGSGVWDNGTDARGGDKQLMTIDKTLGVGSGNIYASWTAGFSSCLPGFFTRSTDGGSNYETCTLVDGYPEWGTMTVGNVGELYICGGNSVFIQKSINAQIPGSLISWDPAVSVNFDGYLGYGSSVNPGGLLGQANIDVDRSNGPGRDNVYIVSSIRRYSNDPGDIMFAKSTDGGLSWSSSVRVNDDNSITNTQWFGTMSVAPNGRIDVIWLDTRDAISGSDSSALYYSYSIDQGNGFSNNQKMSISFDPHVGYPNQNKMGDYFDMVSDNYGAHVAWANTFNGEEDVYYSRITPPENIGIGEYSNNIVFTIFPNPTNGKFTITSPKNIAQIGLYNIHGESILSIPNFATINEIDITTQPAGVYFVKIIDQDGSSGVRKIIKI